VVFFLVSYAFVLPTQPTAPVIKDFMTMMAICHTAVPERTDNTITYQAASPGKSKPLELSVVLIK